MNVQAIINSAADEADDFLAGMTTKSDAKPAIREYVSSHYPSLSPGDNARVVTGLLTLLDNEGFFEAAGTERVAGAAEEDLEL